jgi:hypothetical protein
VLVFHDTKYETHAQYLHYLVCLSAHGIGCHAEELQDFLKRVGTSNATQSDLHTNFHGSVFLGGQTYETDRDKLVEFWQQQKASGIKLAVDSFTTVARTETPDDDGKGAVVSVVVKVSVTENVRGSILKIESVSHFIVRRGSNGAFQLLYTAVPKQVRHA